ncbi:MFS general substrate transporter [Trichoderma velutinum]
MPEIKNTWLLPLATANSQGNTRAWMVVLGAWCASFCTFGWINSIGTFQNYYESTLLKGYSPSTIAWIPSLQIFFMMAMGPLVGSLHDKFGHRSLLLTGTILHTFGLFMASISHKYYQIFLSQGVCSAIGTAAIFLPTLPVVKEWFNSTSEKAKALAVVTTGSSLGGVIFPIMTSRLIDTIGFGWSMRISAFLILFLLIAANLTIKPFPQRIESVRLHSNQATEVLKVLRNDIPFVVLTVGLLVYAFGYFVPIDYIAAEAAAKGVDPNLIQYLIPILNAASLFGRLLSGFAAGKIGPHYVFLTACFITGVLILAVWTLEATAVSRICFAVTFGFFSGAFIALIPALVHSKDNEDNDGFKIGIAFFSASFGGLTTNPICGAILAGGNSWVGPKCFAGVLSLAGTVIVLAAKCIDKGSEIEKSVLKMLQRVGALVSPPKVPEKD